MYLYNTPPTNRDWARFFEVEVEQRGDGSILPLLARIVSIWGGAAAVGDADAFVHRLQAAYRAPGPEGEERAQVRWSCLCVCVG